MKSQRITSNYYKIKGSDLNAKERKNKMTEENKKSLYYITQYANNMSDEQLFNELDWMIKEYDLELDLFIEIADLMPNISDTINERLFKDMISATSDADLQIIIDILTAVDNEDIYELDKLTDYGLERMMNENEIHDESYFAEVADMDLRENGLEASSLSWANDIPCNFEYAELDIYDNFTTMTAAEVIEKFFDEYF